MALARPEPPMPDPSVTVWLTMTSVNGNLTVRGEKFTPSDEAALIGEVWLLHSGSGLTTRAVGFREEATLFDKVIARRDMRAVGSV